jgi:hypothetical protein
LNCAKFFFFLKPCKAPFVSQPEVVEDLLSVLLEMC